MTYKLIIRPSELESRAKNAFLVDIKKILPSKGVDTHLEMQEM